MNGVHRNCAETAAVSRGTSHATSTERYQYTTSVDINNTRYKRIQLLIHNHMRHVRSEAAREQRIALYKAMNNKSRSSNMYWGTKKGRREEKLKSIFTQQSLTQAFQTNLALSLSTKVRAHETGQNNYQRPTKVHLRVAISSCISKPPSTPGESNNHKREHYCQQNPPPPPPIPPTNCTPGKSNHKRDKTLSSAGIYLSLRVQSRT